MNKKIKLALISGVLLTPVLPLLSYSTFYAFFYGAYWIIATALAAKFIFKSN